MLLSIRLLDKPAPRRAGDGTATANTFGWPGCKNCAGRAGEAAEEFGQQFSSIAAEDFDGWARYSRKRSRRCLNRPIGGGDAGLQHAQVLHVGGLHQSVKRQHVDQIARRHVALAVVQHDHAVGLAHAAQDA